VYSAQSENHPASHSQQAICP